jgi:predicted ATP-grasp superfamily ATP-dependent carboligase
VDAIRANGRAVPVEVNPRYTASVEVIERASEVRAIRLHADAASRGRLPEGVLLDQHHYGGKGILYALEETEISGSFSAHLDSINRSVSGCRIADIPATGERIGPGRPVVSLLADADDPQQAETKLQRLAVQLRSRLD